MKSKKIKKIPERTKSGFSKSRKKPSPRESDEYLFRSVLLDQLREYTIGMGADGHILYINPAFANLFRLKPPDMIGRLVFEYEPLFQANLPLEQIIRETITKGRWSGIAESRRQDGKKFFYSFRTRIVRDGKGRIRGLIGVAADISEQVRSKEQLRHSEQQQQQWFDHAFDGIFIIRNHRFEYVNPSFSKMTGYPVEQLTNGEFDYTAIFPESVFRDAVSQARDPIPGLILTHEFPVRLKHIDGSSVEGEASVVFVGEGGSVTVFGIIRDISDRKRAEAALQESERWFQTVFESIGVGMIISDSKGYLIRTNESFQRMVGYTADELKLMRTSDITHPEDFETEVRKLRELIDHPAVNFFQTDKRYIRKDGQVIWARLNTIAVRNENPAASNIFGMIEDITERKYAETLIRIQRDLSVNLSTAVDLETAMNYVLSISLKIEEISSGCIYVSDRWKNIRFLTQTNLSPVLNEKLPVLPQGHLRRSFFSSDQVRYMRYQDFILHLDVGFDEDLKHEDYHHVTILPVVHENEPICVIVLFSAGHDRISVESKEVLESITAQLGGIVSRLRMVDALIGSEERYRRLLNSATDYVVSVVVTQGQPVKSYHGERCVAVTGYSPEDFERDHYLWFNMVFHDDQPKVSELVSRVLNGETVPPLEHRIYHKDGTIRWIRHTVVSRYNQHGELSGYDALISDISGRKNAELLLIEQEEHYRAIFEGARIGIFLETFDGKILNANPAACRMLGYTLEELRQITIEQIVPQDYSESVEILRRPEDDVPVIIAENIRKDGSRIWVEVVRRVVNINQQLVALIFVEDITQRKRSESELLLQNSRFQQLFANNPLGMIMVDHMDRVIMINRAFTGIFQYQEQDVLSREINSLIIPESMKNEASSLSDKTQHGEPVEYESVRLRKDGSYVDVHIWGVPIMFNHGQIGVFGIYADITDRKRAEAAIRDSEEKYRTLFEESKDAVYISTPEGYFININSAGVQLFGYATAAELCGVSIPESVYDRPEDRRKFQELISGKGYIRDFEVTLRKKDGGKIEALITATAVKDDQGRIVAYRGIIRDNTSYKQLQRQLIQAQKMESIGTLSGGIAHDFNNVLAVVLSTAELIRKRTAGNEDLAELTQMIINSAMRGRSITQQLLLFSRSDNPILRPVSLNDIITENVKLLEHSLPKSIAIQVHTLNADDLIMADISHLHQIILNLAINARDAMSNGGTLTLVVDRVSSQEIRKKWSEADENDYVALFISDTGTGIPAELHTRIFDPFFTTKDQGKGTGLGLSIVHGIVKNHKGFIELDSQPGLGATFRIYFPAHDETQRVEEPLTNEIKILSGNETILIVDDEPDLLQLLKDILSMSGYKVLPAQNGVEAIRVYHEYAGEIRLVISDIGMPEMDGIQLFRHLREIRPDIPVIVATGYMGDTTARSLLEEGIAEILFKPYSVADILKTIRHILDNPDPTTTKL